MNAKGSPGTGGFLPISNPYDGFDWNNVYVGPNPGSAFGYVNGVVSPGHDAFDGFTPAAASGRTAAARSRSTAPTSPVHSANRR